MPKALEAKLKRQASKKGLKGKRALQYIHGTLTNIEKRRKAKSARR